MTRADGTPPGVLVLPRGAPGYPTAANDLPDPPERCYVQGTWPLGRPVVAVVGSRAATAYGLAFARRLAGDLARLGMTVASGLAHGVDAAAHRGALEAGGPTLAVLPGGLDAIVPRSHAALAEEIARRGTLVSERGSGAPRHGGAFLERNRLIAALADAVVVPEARVRSGALNTARHARALGRPVLAVPGDVDRETSRGCHQLLRDGARVCEGVADLVAVLEAGTAERRGPSAVAAAAPDGGGPAARADGGAPLAARLRAILAAGPRSAEACAREAGASLAETQAALLELEWAGLAARRPGARWAGR